MKSSTFYGLKPSLFEKDNWWASY